MKITDLKGDIQVVNTPYTGGINIGSQETQPSGFSFEETLKNVPASAGRFVGGIAKAVASPIQTGKALLGTAAGAVEKIIPGEQAEEQYFDNLVTFYKRRYGSAESFLQTLEEDPVGVAADISTALSGVGVGLKAVGASRAASGVSKVAQATNPLAGAGRVTALAKNYFPNISGALEKSSLRLTSGQKAQLGNKVNTISDYLASKRIFGSPQTRYDKATALYNGMEKSLDTFFSSIAKGHGVEKSSLIRGLQSLKGQYKNNRDYTTIAKQIDGAIKTIDKTQGDIIPYKNLQELKRTTYSNAYNQAGTKVLDDVEHAIGDIVRGQMEKGLEGLKVSGQPLNLFNKDYGLLIEGRKLLKAAIGKPEVSGVTQRLLGALIGSATSGGGGALFGAAVAPTLIGNIPITAARSSLGAAVTKLGQTKIPPSVSRLKTPVTAIERIAESQ